MKRLVLYFCILVLSNLFAQNYEWVRTGKFKDGSDYSDGFMIGIDANRNQYYFVKSLDSLIYENTLLGESCSITPFSDNTGIMSLNPDGSFRWFKKKSCTDFYSEFVDARIGSDGNMYLVGNFQGDFYFDGVYYASSTDSLQDFVMKLDHLGNVLWFGEIESLSPPINPSFPSSNINVLAVNSYGNQVHLVINAYNDFKIKDYVVHVTPNHFSSYLIALDNQTLSGIWAVPVLDSTNYWVGDLEYSIQGDILAAFSQSLPSSSLTKDTIHVMKYDKNIGTKMWETKINHCHYSASWGIASDKYNNVYVSVSSLSLSQAYEPRVYQLALSNGTINWYKGYPTWGRVSGIEISPATNNVYFSLQAYPSLGAPSEYSLHGLSQNGTTIFYAKDSILNIHKKTENISFKLDHCGDFYFTSKFDTTFTLMDNTLVPQNYTNIWSPQVQSSYNPSFLIAKFPIENQCGSTVFLEEMQEESVLLYPNPTENLLHISHSATKAEIEIWDSFGHRVLAKNIKQEEEIETESLSAGIYILKLHSDRGNFVQKFVKK